MDKIIYGNGTLSRSVIGEPSIIAKYSSGLASDLHRQSHIVQQATLLVYGNVTKAQLKGVLGSLPIQEDFQHPLDPTATEDWVEEGFVTDRVSISQADLSEYVFLYRKLVPLVSCDTPVRCAMVAQIVKNALDSALPGGLAGPLRFDQFVARSFSFHIDLIKNHYIEVSFTAHPDNGVSLEALETEFRSTLETTLESGLTQATFERVKSRLTGQLKSVLDRDRPAYNRDLILDQLMAGKPTFSLADQMSAVEEVQLEDVNQFLKSLLAKGRETTRLVSAEG
ncbi:hypothetical protein TRICHSKD4_6022 [Roseibium sp. TrichSKD4]|nr:hypothetical protein TRICHSKD4_6022 [Roseibium sp. TrichSKD4]